MSQNSGSSHPSKDFLAAVGSLTLNWGVIEGALDFWVAVIFHEFDGDKIEKEIPRSLAVKLKFLRRGLRHSKLSAIQPAADALLVKIQNEKAHRHEIIHGSLSDRGGGDTVEMLRIRYEKHSHMTSLHTVTKDDIESAAIRALELADPVVMIATKLYDFARPDDPIDNYGR